MYVVGVPDCVPWGSDGTVNFNREQWQHAPGRCFTIAEAGIARRRLEFTSYKYMNSIGCLIGRAKPVLLEYGALVHMDLDTFLTPLFLSWWPVHAVFVGEGGYGFLPRVNTKLEFLAEEMGLQSLKGAGHNLGSSWYGPSNQIIAVAELTLETVRYLIEVEFAHQPCWLFRTVTPDDLSKDCETSDFSWGNGFYPGVAGMYGTELALNHLWAITNGTRMQLSFASVNLLYDGVDTRVQIPSMDCNTAYDFDVCSTAHLHTFHTDERFSKFEFEAGNYSSINVTQVWCDRLDS